MKNFTESMKMGFGEVTGAHIMKRVNTGIDVYDTLCFICAELNMDLSKVSDHDFDSAGIALKQFCESANESTGFTVSVWFD